MSLDSGTYVAGESQLFPELSPEVLVEFADPLAPTGYPAMLGGFRKWLVQRKG